MGNLLSIVVHAANIHDTKSGILAAQKACEKYPSIQAFCADAGYRGTFIAEVQQQLQRRVDISEKIKPHEWEKLPWRWIVDRTFTWMYAARRVRHSSACIYQDGGCSSEIFVAILPGKEPVVGT